jgi:hypothetical protein
VTIMMNMTMAQACGEAPILDTGWTPGVDFDPHDEEEMQVMHLVWQREARDNAARLEAENNRLRERIAELGGDDYDGDAYLNTAYDDAL